MMCDNSDTNNRLRLLSISSSNPNRSKCSPPDRVNSLPSCHISRNTIHIQVPRSSQTLTIDESKKRDNDTISYGIKLDNLSSQQLSHQYSYWKASSEDLNGEIENYMNSLHSTLDALENIPTQYACSKSSNPCRPSAPIASQLWIQTSAESGYDSGRSSAAYSSSCTHNHGLKTLSNQSSNSTSVSDNEDDSVEDPPEIATSCHNLPALLPRPLHLMPPTVGFTKLNYSLSRPGGTLPSLVPHYSSPSEEKKESLQSGIAEFHGAVESPTTDTIMIQQRFPNLSCRMPYGQMSPMKATPLRHSLHSAFKPARINHPYVAFAKSH